jgi:dTMP kinase
MRGLFVTFEGIDRSGKTTQARLLCEALGADALGVREPGGTEAGERVRAILKDQSISLAPETDAILFAAARAELVSEVILPALAEDRVVVSDRFLDSSLAYQGGARGLGFDAVRQLNAFATRGLAPDRTLLLRIEPEVALARAAGRGGTDRLEREGLDFAAATAAAYDRLAAAEPARFAVIDAAQAPDAVLRDALQAL